MTTQTKSLVAIVLAVIIAGAIYGAYLYPQSQYAVSSSAGTTFNSAKIAGESVTVATDTVFSISNTDASARTIRAAEVFLTGGAATNTLYTIACATSSTAGGINSNTNYVLKQSLNIYDGTTTPSGKNFFVASTSPGIMGTSTTATLPAYGLSLTGNVARSWPSGTYLVCKLTTTSGSNDNLFDAGMTGTISFPYSAQ